MPQPTPSPRRQPAYRLHRACNCAVVTLNGKNHYLGPWQSPESHEKYARLIAEWSRGGGALPAEPEARPPAGGAALTIDELVLAYFRFALGRYVKNGGPTSEVGCLRQALRPVRRLFGSTPAAEFGPRALKSVRQAMVDSGRCRKSVNKDVHRVKRMARWAVEEELLPAAVYDRLRCVAALAKGATAARETGKVPPVPEADILAALPHLPPPVAAMVRFQLLTGARPQEAMRVRPGDLAQGDGVWYYTPRSHKTEHLGREKCVVVGPRAHEVLLPFLARDPESYCFRPAESAAWGRARRRGEAAPTAPVGDGHLNPCYTRHSYRVAVQRACRKAGVPAWSPNRLRHTRATQVRAESGSLEAAKAVLGHSDTRVTEVYAARDLRLAAEVMRRIG